MEVCGDCVEMRGDCVVVCGDWVEVRGDCVKVCGMLRLCGSKWRLD